MRTIVSKSQYAQRKHRSRACITKWIKSGKISSAALIGDGQAAKIWVEQADADLIKSLSPNQQWCREHPANTSSSFLQNITKGYDVW